MLPLAEIIASTQYTLGTNFIITTTIFHLLKSRANLQANWTLGMFNKREIMPHMVMVPEVGGIVDLGEEPTNTTLLNKHNL